jgi:predicted nuclease of predicted toxin-antitoxin system
VKLLIDENLPPSLVREVQTRFPDSEHVLALGLGSCSDTDIFRFAAEHGFAILTKDDDFEVLSAQFGAPPKIVLFAVGNMLLRDLHALAARKLPYIEEFLGAASDYQLLKIGRG